MKVLDPKTKIIKVVFQEYPIEATVCPKCNQLLKERDYKLIEQISYTRCLKCGAKLKNNSHSNNVRVKVVPSSKLNICYLFRGFLVRV